MAKRKHAIPTKRLGHAQRAERRKKIAAFMRRTKDLPGACQKFGVGHQTVKNACAEHGIDWK